MKTIVHIGANKTASTLFQRQLFAKHNKIAYIGEDCDNYSDIKQDLDLLIHEDASVYNEMTLKKIIEDKLSEHKTMVFSSEDIMGTRHPSVCAKRLKELFPEGKVIMVLRNQKSTWITWYINHGSFLKPVPKRYWKRYVSFKEWLSYCFTFPYTTPVEAMNYEKYYQIFKKEFGEENIHIFLYEDLVKNPNHFYEQWGQLLGISTSEIRNYLDNQIERTSMTSLEFKVHQVGRVSTLLSGLLKKLFGNLLKKGPTPNVSIPKEWETKINDYYAEGNTKLNMQFNLNLEKYNYPLMPSSKEVK